MELPLALSPESNEAFLREVDEELRRDQLLGFWRRWGRWLIVAIIVALGALALVLFLNHRGQARTEEQGEKLNSAIQDLAEGKVTSARATIDQLATNADPGIRALAMMNQGNLALSKNDLKGAAARFAAIAGDSTLPQTFRDLALIRQTNVEFDTLKPEMVIQRLFPMATPNSPWFGSAGEMVAMAYIKQGKRAEAAKLFSQIAQQKDMPPELSQRAVQMAGAMGVDVVQSGEKKAK